MADSQDLPEFGADDAWEIIERIQSLHNVVLVGGQALNFWAEYYRDNDSFWPAHAPYTSKDIDFLATPQEVKECARLLSAKAYLAEPFDPTPNSGKITLDNFHGRKLEIDFMADLYGMDRNHILERSVLIEYQNIKFRVMHPFYCMESRLHNCFGALRRLDQHGLNQLLVSIKVMEAFMRGLLGRVDGERSALNFAQQVAALALSTEGKAAYAHSEIELLEAVPACLFKSDAFRNKGWPMQRKQVDDRRQAFIRNLLRRIPQPAYLVGWTSVDNPAQRSFYASYYKTVAEAEKQAGKFDRLYPHRVHHAFDATLRHHIETASDLAPNAEDAP